MSRTRPVLENLITDNMSEAEVFQNKTLRPIIKMQHNLLIVFFKSYLKKRKIDFFCLTAQKKRSRVKAILQKTSILKNLNLGLIIGDFSMEEYAFYDENSSELNRRILQIIAQRIQDSLDEI